MSSGDDESAPFHVASAARKDASTVPPQISVKKDNLRVNLSSEFEEVRKKSETGAVTSVEMITLVK